MNAYFNWYLEASKRGYDRVTFLQEARNCLKLYQN